MNTDDWTTEDWKAYVEELYERRDMWKEKYEKEQCKNKELRFALLFNWLALIFAAVLIILF
jgi:cytolysin (calcineurin-like family phosphatase)